MASEKTPLLGDRSTGEVTHDVTQNDNRSSYSVQTGFIYVFNLVIGAGVLALPKSFAKVGWLLGLMALVFLALMSYITLTFTIEAMALANAMLRYKTSNPIDSKCEEDVSEEKKFIVDGDMDDKVRYKRTKDDKIMFPAHEDKEITNRKKHSVVTKPSIKFADDSYTSSDLNELYDIRVKFELGDMSKLFFNKIGVVLYYISICLYLYGSATVYVAVVCKSLATVICDDVHAFDGNSTVSCRRFPSISVLGMYRVMMLIFIVVICPFAYFDVKNTKLLQVLTTLYRWFSMTTMIILALIKITQNKDTYKNKKAVVVSELPNFIGVALYAFMCQHSIPAVLTPVSNKKHLTLVLGLDFLCIVAFYSIILVTAVFAFPEDSIQDVYTMNFSQPIYLGYLLQLFPVLTLSATFPVFSIVLRDNIKSLILTNPEKNYGFFLERILFSSVSIIPPLIGAFLTYDVESLVNYTGSYMGAIVQYVVPAAMVFFGRSVVQRTLGKHFHQDRYQSPFKGKFWVVFVILWYFLCLAVVIYNTIIGN